MSIFFPFFCFKVATTIGTTPQVLLHNLSDLEGIEDTTSSSVHLKGSKQMSGQGIETFCFLVNIQIEYWIQKQVNNLSWIKQKCGYTSMLLDW